MSQMANPLRRLSFGRPMGCATRAADLLQDRADLEGRSLSNLITFLLEAASG